MKHIVLLAAAALLLTGCIRRADVYAIKCYSGGVVLFDGKGTHFSEPIYAPNPEHFKEWPSGKDRRINADCTVDFSHTETSE